MTKRPADAENRLLKEELGPLFESHREGLAGAVRGILGSAADVHEVLQDAFLAAWRAIDRGHRPQEITGWLFVVVMNTARDQRRRRMRRPDFAPLEESITMPTQKASPDRPLIARETAAAARRAIESLGDAEKEVFLLRVSGGLSFDAIAATLAIPSGTAKTRMRRALLRLRELLVREDERTDS